MEVRPVDPGMVWAWGVALFVGAFLLLPLLAHEVRGYNAVFILSLLGNMCAIVLITLAPVLLLELSIGNYGRALWEQQPSVAFVYGAHLVASLVLGVALGYLSTKRIPRNRSGTESVLTV